MNRFPIVTHRQHIAPRDLSRIMGDADAVFAEQLQPDQPIASNGTLALVGFLGFGTLLIGLVAWWGFGA